jgi:hypothetical protein
MTLLFAATDLNHHHLLRPVLRVRWDGSDRCMTVFAASCDTSCGVETAATPDLQSFCRIFSCCFCYSSEVFSRFSWVASGILGRMSFFKLAWHTFRVGF